jgi:hypothetical protein
MADACLPVGRFTPKKYEVMKVRNIWKDKESGFKIKKAAKKAMHGQR